jgi:predicted Rossmann fold nucleotide-binding protein DprA/Smf involved in DNA uptake
MSEQKRDWQKDLKVLRERLGGISEKKKAWGKEQRETIKAIRGAMAGGPATIPEIIERTKLPGEKVVWHLMALKKYGRVAECGQSGDCFRYALKEGAA